MILWDEISMCSKHIILGVDRFMRDLCQIDEPFGGKIVLFAGDFRQTLPIVKGGNIARSVSICFKNCTELWSKVKHYSLVENMRASSDIRFSQWLLNIGDGNHQSPCNEMKDFAPIPNEIVLTGNKSDLASFALNSKDVLTPEMVTSSFNAAILSPLNEDADKLNDLIISRMDGHKREYFSADKLISDDFAESDLYPIESLINQTPNGYPPHVLCLKIGCIVMCLKNIAIHLGLCNGTRMKIIALYSDLIECEILYGRFKNKKYFISRYRFLPDMKNLPPCAFERIQFPLKLAFAMTINKSQGQTFDRIAIYLPEPVFAHGQLYVAFSRVRTFQAVKVLIHNKNSNTKRHGQIVTGDNAFYTKNIVCKAVLTKRYFKDSSLHFNR